MNLCIYVYTYALAIYSHANSLNNKIPFQHREVEAKIDFSKIALVSFPLR